MSVSLDIQEQPRLPMRKQVEICADGIHHRLFRSAVTVSVVALAIAFLMNVLIESVVVGSVTRRGVRHGAEATALPRFTRFIARPIDMETFRWQLAEAAPDSWQTATLATWLEVTPDAVATLRARSQEAQRHQDWLGNLSIAHQRLLLERRSPDEALRWLATDAGAAAFRAAVVQTPSVSEPDGLVAFAGAYGAWLTDMATSMAAINARASLAGGPLLARLAAAHASVDTRRALERDLSAFGVAWTEPMLARLADEASQSRRRQRLMDMLAQPDIAGAWQRAFGQVADHDAMLADLAGNLQTCAWLAARSDDEGLPAEAIHAAAQQLTDTRRLTALRNALGAGHTDGGVGANVFWLTVVSFLVCVVGITNAMLVSVIERFREIATMKCLGALDGFIAVLFLLEAACFGVVGGLLGVVLGFAIGSARMWWRFGNFATAHWPWGDVGAAAGGSLVAAMGLATVAAIYPAYRASRMPPMEAMRVE